MNAQAISKPLPVALRSASLTLAGVTLLSVAIATHAQGSSAAPSASKPVAQAVAVEPCRMLLGSGGITLLTSSGAKCQAGAPLMLSAASVDQFSARLCDFGKAIVKTKAATYQDVDSVQCIFNGNPLPGSVRVRYGRIVNNKVVEITE